MKYLAAALLAPHLLLAQPAMPAWLASYPGTSPEVRSLPALVESAYTAPAGAANVLEYYRLLFEAAKLAWIPNSDGVGTVIRGAAPECDLMIKIREQAGGTSVRVSCAVKSAPMVAVSRATVAPAPEPPTPQPGQRLKTRLNWPSWLIHPEGKPMTFQKGAQGGDAAFVTTSFTVADERAGIHSFYEELLPRNGCPITSAGKAWMECTWYPEGRGGARMVVRIELTALPEATRADLRVTTFL